MEDDLCCFATRRKRSAKCSQIADDCACLALPLPAQLGRVWGYNVATKNLRVIGQFRPEFFKEGVDPSKFKTIDEESSGVIDVSHILGDGWWLLDAQSHLRLDGEELGASRCVECVEDGQFLALYVAQAAKRK